MFFFFIISVYMYFAFPFSLWAFSLVLWFPLLRWLTHFQANNENHSKIIIVYLNLYLTIPLYLNTSIKKTANAMPFLLLQYFFFLSPVVTINETVCLANFLFPVSFTCFLLLFSFLTIFRFFFFLHYCFFPHLDWWDISFAAFRSLLTIYSELFRFFPFSHH